MQAADADDASTIAAIGHRLGEAPVGLDHLRVRIPVADRAGALLDLAVRLREADVVPADITVRRPSLDEVFFELTAGARSVSGNEVAA